MNFLRKKIFLFISFFAISFSGFSLSLSFQIVQHNESLNSVCKSAYIIEDELMNYFFDNGFIVSNAEASLSSSSSDDRILWNKAFMEAKEGSFDDFVQVHLYFNENANNEEKVSLGLIDSVSWKLVRTKDGKCLEDEKANVKKPMGSDSEENVRNFAGDFASHIKKVLENRV